MSRSILLLQGALLSTLAFQNCGMGFLLSHQRPETSEYNPASAVAIAEALKFLVSAVFVLLYSRPKEERAGPTEASVDMRHLSNASYLWKKLVNRGALMVALVAALFVLQANLKVISAPLVTPTRFQILSQSGLIFVVAASIVILKTSISRMQWLAVVLTISAVILLQLQPTVSKESPQSDPIEARTPTQQRLGSIGMLAVGLLGSVAGVLIEKAMRTTDMWIINSQLALFSLIPAATPLVFSGKNIVAGFDWIAWLTVLNLAFGGLLVALVVKNCGNVAKTLTTPFAILLSYFISSAFLGAPWEWSTVAAGCVVTCSCVIYNKFKPQVVESPQESAPAWRLVQSNDVEMGDRPSSEQALFSFEEEEKEAERSGEGSSLLEGSETMVSSDDSLTEKTDAF